MYLVGQKGKKSAKTHTHTICEIFEEQKEQDYTNISDIVSKDLKPSNPQAPKPLCPQTLKLSTPQTIKP